MSETPLRERPLVDLKLEFRRAQREHSEFCRTLPSSIAIAKGETDYTAEQREQLERQQKHLSDLAVAIQGNAAFDGVSPVERRDLMDAAEKAVKAGG